MKKIVSIFMILVFFIAAPNISWAASDIAEDNVIEKLGDWLATVGKSEEDRDAMVAERQADRAAERLRKMLKKESKAVEKKMKKFGKEMEKMFE